MRDYSKFYIDGKWVDPAAARSLDVINPATEQVAGIISLGSETDVDRAAAAARSAFESYSRTSREDRLEILDNLLAEFQRRHADVASAITEEMGAPRWLAEQVQAFTGAMHLQVAIGVLKEYEFEKQRGTTRIVHEPIGVCGFITPWNWPINQIVAKVAPAIAVGCTVVLKPSEIAPFSAHLWAEIVDAAGVPAGVFNLVDGIGSEVGAAISSHPDIDMVSFTGSTRAGIDAAKRAAERVKRVHQELGGKSPNIILDDADFATAIPASVQGLMINSGQTCHAPTRMLVPAARMEEAKAIAKAAAQAYVVGDPSGNVQLGPVVSSIQFDKIQRLIQAGIDEGATLVTGGTGRPDGLTRGYYVKPTVFGDVTNDMTIATQEIFGPVLVLIGYEDEEDAVRIANDTEYGLAAYVQSGSLEHARAVASRLRAGQVNINNAPVDPMAPFGGYKMSGNGREWGDHAFSEFLETKAVLGFEAVTAAS